MIKKCWVCVRISERVSEIIKAVAATMGISCSEFVRQAVLEKLQSLSVIGSEVKAELSKREYKMEKLEKNQRLIH